MNLFDAYYNLNDVDTIKIYEGFYDDLIHLIFTHVENEYNPAIVIFHRDDSPSRYLTTEQCLMDSEFETTLPQFNAIWFSFMKKPTDTASYSIGLYRNTDGKYSESDVDKRIFVEENELN